MFAFAVDLQDSQDSHVQALLEFPCVRPLRTVYALLEEKGQLALLSDPLMHKATEEIVAGDRPRDVVSLLDLNASAAFALSEDGMI
jgi:hypothetical protein